MDEQLLRTLIDDVAAGRRSADDLVALVRQAPTADLGFALVDHHRALRQGMPEAVYGPGKAVEHCVAIVGELLRVGGPVLLSRASSAQRDAVLALHPGAVVTPTAPGTSTLVWNAAPERTERVLIVSAGTADLAVANECAATMRAYGFMPTMLNDCGVAGLHRLLAHLDTVTRAQAIVTVAGMEGALASVIGGLTSVPVVAVPANTGYGASFEGITALLAMLSSCAAGITVVGIDNGYGAACAIARLLGATEGSRS